MLVFAYVEGSNPSRTAFEKICWGDKIRLGEFRSLTREKDNRLFIRLSDYNDLGNAVKVLEVDIVTDDAIYFRVIDE